MKKIYHLMLMMVVSLSAMTVFTSCEDDDTDTAYVLAGQWRGDFGMCYWYTDPRTGREYRFDSYDTDIVFYPDYDYATHGYGKQVDFYGSGPYRYQYYMFDWEVRNGVLYLWYPYDVNLNTRIYDYRMTYDYFTGYIGDLGTRFKLYKISDYYDWSIYNGDYGYGYYDDYHYSKPRDGKTVNSTVDSLNIRRGNRFNMNKD